MRDHALREQAGERLAARQVEQAAVAQGAGEEAGVEQVEHRVLDAADVLIDGQPVGSFLLVDRLFRFRVGETRKIPGTVDERIHRVRLALGLASAGGTFDVAPCRMADEGIAGCGEVGVVGQHDGQLVVRHGDGAALRALDDRDRATPVALARHAPVAQAVLRGGFTGLAIQQRFYCDGDGVLRSQTVEEVGVVDRAFACVGLATNDVGFRVGAGRQDDGLEGQAVFLGEFDVALVAGGRAEDRAGTVGRQHEVRGPDGQLP